MDKTLIYPAIGFFSLEALALIGIIISQINFEISKELLVIGFFGFINLIFITLLLVGILKEEKPDKRNITGNY